MSCSSSHCKNNYQLPGVTKSNTFRNPASDILMDEVSQTKDKRECWGLHKTKGPTPNALELTFWTLMSSKDKQGIWPKSYQGSTVYNLWNSPSNALKLKTIWLLMWLAIVLEK